MSGLIALAAFQIGLVICLIFLVSKLVGMINAGAPLISMQNPFKRPAAQPKAVPSKQSGPHEADGGRIVSFRLPLPHKRDRTEPAGKFVQDQITDKAKLGRSRKLLTLSELESASNRAAAEFPENYYAEIEARLEEFFQAYLATEITLADYFERIRKENALAQAVLRNDHVLLDPQLRAEAERAAAAIEWCHEWATGQAIQCRDGLAA